MIAVALVMMGVGFGWAALNYGAASMHPTPSQTNLGTHIVFGGIVGLLGVVVLIGSLFL